MEAMAIDVILNPDNTFAETVKPDVCTACGGDCCKSLPGISSPEQWGAPDKPEMIRRLTDAFKAGTWAVDCWDGDPREDKDYMDDDYLSSADFVRPRCTNALNRIRDESFGGSCVFLREHGCSLEFSVRPLGCRTLIPKGKGKGCESRDDYGGKRSMAIAWIPYHDVIDAAVAAAEGR